MRTITRLALLLVAIGLFSPIAPAKAAGCYDPQPGLDYSNCSFVGIDLSGRDLTNVRLTNADLTNTNLSGADLTGVVSGGITGTPSQLPENWNLIGGYLFGPGANLYATTIQDLNLSNLNLAGAQIWGAIWSNVNLRNTNLSEANFQGATLSNTNLAFANATDANFTNAKLFDPDLSDAIFNNANFQGLLARGIVGTAANLPTDWKMAQGFLIGPSANLISADLLNIDFRQMNITGANLNYANLTLSNFNGMDLSVASFKFSYFGQTSIEGANLDGLDLEGVRSQGVIGTPSALPEGWKLRSGFLIGPKANLSSMNLSNVNFSGTNLAGTYLAAANLGNANLAGVDLRETFIEGANLSGANLEQTDLTGVSLNGIIGPNIIGQPIGLDPEWQFLHGYLIGPGANLTTVDFRNLDLTTANLKGVNFIYANLSGANLTGVDLTGVNLTGVNLTETILEGANLDEAIMFEVIGRDIVGVPSKMPASWRFLEGFLLGPGVNLSSADLRGLDLRNIDLTGASLASANLTGADLRGAKLTGANLADSNFTGTRLLNVITGNVTGTPIGLPKDFSFADGTIKVTLILSPTPKAVGMAKVGGKLTAIPGTWDVGVTLSYQWYRNGFAINGATAKTYTLVPADLKKGVSVAVTGTGTGGVQKTKLSLQTPVAVGVMSTKAPKIAGAVAKGKTVTATTVAWVTGAKISYSWLLNGKPIKGATKNTYKILPSQVGKKLSVLVKQTATGYTAASKASLAVKVK
jgi:uncharacterized protein YjbI with pentapeptide repeats